MVRGCQPDWITSQPWFSRGLCPYSVFFFFFWVPASIFNRFPWGASVCGSRWQPRKKAQWPVPFFACALYAYNHRCRIATAPLQFIFYFFSFLFDIRTSEQGGSECMTKIHWILSPRQEKEKERRLCQDRLCQKSKECQNVPQVDKYWPSG